MIQANQGPWGGGGGAPGGPPGGYGPPPGGGPPGGGGYGGPPGGGGYGGPPGGGGYGGPPGGGGYGGPPGGGGYGGPPGGAPPGGGGFGGPPGGYGGPPPGGFGGAPQYTPQMPGGMRPGGMMKTDPLAILALVLGLCSVPTGFCCSFFGIPLSLAAIIMGLISMSNIGKKPQELGGKGMAIGGIATGSIGIVVFILALIFAVGGSVLRGIF